MSLNYYAINKVLGGKMVLGRRVRFGAFGQMSVRAEAERHRPRPEPRVQLSLEDERSLVEAFEDVRGGRAPDRLLWDVELANRFHRKARSLGVHAPGKILTRRIINIRKNSTRYRKLGIEIQPSTVKEPHASIVSRYAHAVEFALVRLRYRYGASIDDVLMDPALGVEYIELASEMAKGLTEEQLRLGALYIRKSRFMARKDQTLFEDLNVQEIEPALQPIGSFAEAEVDAVPESIGLIEVAEPKRTLYIARNTDLRAAVGELVKSSTLASMANRFWHPNPQLLTLRILPGESFENVTLRYWQLKLIAEREPVFNWPVHKAA